MAGPRSDSSSSRKTGPKIHKVKAAVSAREKHKPGKTLDLSHKAASDAGIDDKKEESQDGTPLLQALPPTFRDSCEELRKLDLSGQINLLRNGGLGMLRFTGGTLTWLNLSGMNLGNDVPGGSANWAFLPMLQTLFVLTMSNCNLSELPQQLSSLTSLKALVATQNSLTTSSLNHLANLTSLNSLILSNNTIASFPTDILASLKSLKKISLANNKLTNEGVPDFSVVGQTLEEVRLNGNEKITYIPTSLTKANSLPLLGLVELSHTSISDLSEIAELKNLPKLINLGLRNTPVSHAAGYKDHITEALPRLRILDNVRFDPLFLERKANQKEGHKLDQNQRRPMGKKQPGMTDGGWAQRKASIIQSSNTEAAAVPSTSAGKRKRESQTDVVPGSAKDNKAPGKRKKVEEAKEHNAKAVPRANTEAKPNGTGKGKGKEDTEPKVYEQADSGTMDSLPITASTKKTAGQKKAEKKARHKAEAAAAMAAKIPRTIGGSLGGPSMKDKSATQAVADKEKTEEQEVDLAKLAKSRSAVAGIIEVEKDPGRFWAGNDGSRKKGKRKGATEQDQPSRQDNTQDVLAVLAKDNTASKVVSGWD